MRNFAIVAFVILALAGCTTNDGGGDRPAGVSPISTIPAVLSLGDHAEYVVAEYQISVDIRGPVEVRDETDSSRVAVALNFTWSRPGQEPFADSVYADRATGRIIHVIAGCGQVRDEVTGKTECNIYPIYFSLVDSVAPLLVTQHSTIMNGESDLNVATRLNGIAVGGIYRLSDAGHGPSGERCRSAIWQGENRPLDSTGASSIVAPPLSVKMCEGTPFPREASFGNGDIAILLKKFEPGSGGPAFLGTGEVLAQPAPPTLSKLTEGLPPGAAGTKDAFPIAEAFEAARMRDASFASFLNSTPTAVLCRSFIDTAGEFGSAEIGPVQEGAVGGEFVVRTLEMGSPKSAVQHKVTVKKTTLTGGQAIHEILSSAESSGASCPRATNAYPLDMSETRARGILKGEIQALNVRAEEDAPRVVFADRYHYEFNFPGWTGGTFSIYYQVLVDSADGRLLRVFGGPDLVGRFGPQS